MSAPLRAFVLRGGGATAALDWLHVHAEVCGAVEAERDGAPEVVVWLPGPLPALPPACRGALQVVELPVAEANRTATGREGDAPIRIAPDLLVRPPWVPRPADFTGVELVVPRGMAFGSGEHASTRAALLAMHRAWCAPASFADIGTGSGILASYAAVRGCPSILACDVDPAAVAAARELVPRATVVAGGAEALPAPSDFVVANLSAGELAAALAAVLAAWRAPRRAPLVLGGLRRDELAAVVRRLPAAPQVTAVGDFCALTLAPGA